MKITFSSGINIEINARSEKGEVLIALNMLKDFLSLPSDSIVPKNPRYGFPLFPKRLQKRVCECGKPIPGNRRKYCSKACYIKASNENALEWYKSHKKKE
jgi:hypothetical protein